MHRETGGDAEEAAVPPRLVTALLLAWAASRARSLLAARCLVAAALELYARGATADDVQLCLSLAGVQERNIRRSRRCKGDDTML
jgi:hypothetical protein